MACSCGESSNCGNCGRVYSCSCNEPDRTPDQIKCRDGEPCDIALNAGCVVYQGTPNTVGLPAGSSVEEILAEILRPNSTYLTAILVKIQNDPQLKTLFCQIVNSC